MTETRQTPTAHIFVGADRSQALAVRVLEFSIRRRTDLNVTLRSMHDLALPDATDQQHRARTGFSFTRFAIPELMGHQGRALYLDADMLVLRDLRELYDLPFESAKVLVQGDVPDGATTNLRTRRIRQSSVMLLDCAALDWNAERIIAGLGSAYTYEELMQQLCILAPEAIGYAIPFHWNSLELYEPGKTGLLHYTDMNTQPWVHAANPNGFLWLNEVRDMLQAGALSMDDVREEVRLGYARPSLLEEIAQPHDAASSAHWRAIDAAAGFEPHREFLQKARERRAAPLGASFKQSLKTLTQRFAPGRRSS